MSQPSELKTQLKTSGGNDGLPAEGYCEAKVRRPRRRRATEKHGNEDPNLRNEAVLRVVPV